MSELESILAELETALERCKGGLLRSDELRQLLEEAADRARKAVSQESDAFRILDRGLPRTTWLRKTIHGYADPGECDLIARHREVVLAAANRIEPEFLRDAASPKRQHYFEEGDTYRAMRMVYALLQSAEESVDVVDAYLDAIVFDFIRSLDPSLRWRLLTKGTIPIFASLLTPTVAEGFHIEARKNSSCHDRFIVLDGGVAVWHLGASLNGLGKKAFMLNVVSDPSERSRFLADFTTWWSAGAVIS